MDGWIVVGGELESIPGQVFAEPDKVEFVGYFTDPVDAHQAWKARAQQTVDNAHMRFFILPMSARPGHV